MAAVVHTAPGWFAALVFFGGPLCAIGFGVMAYRGLLPRLAIAFAVGLLTFHGILRWADRIESWAWPLNQVASP